MRQTRAKPRRRPDDRTHARDRPLRGERRHRDDHAESSRRDERPRRRDQGGVAGRRTRGGAGRRRAVRGADRQRPCVLRGPGPQGAHHHPGELRRGVAVPHRRGALQPDRDRARHHAQARGGRRQRRRRRCRREPRLRLRLPRPHRGRRVQPRLHRRRPVLRHRLLVDPPPHRRPGEGAGAALLPAHDRLGRVPRARAGHDRGRGRRVRAGGRDARAPARRRPHGVVRRHPPLGGVLRRRTTSPSHWPSRAR